MINISNKTDLIKKIALEIGFNKVGFVELTKIDENTINKYNNWINNGYNAQMDYLIHNNNLRFNPKDIFHGANSAIVVLVSYDNTRPKLNSKYKISRYALSTDYHYIIKNKLNLLLSKIKDINNDIDGRALVDSAPVMERYWAVKAGLGFIGKNGMLINPELGSYTFIGTLFINAKIEVNEKTINSTCDSCNKCIKACPNNSILINNIIDSNKCISYNTIEHKTDINNKLDLKHYIFGCDICQEVCPYNKNLDVKIMPKLIRNLDIVNFSTSDWKNIGSSKFKKTFSPTPLFRTGLKRIRRNIEFIDSKE